MTEEAALAKLDELYYTTDNVSDKTFWEFIRDNYYYDNNMNFIGYAWVVLSELTSNFINSADLI